MRKILFAAILLASPFAALGATRIDIVVRIPDYDLSQFNGSASGSELHDSVVSEKEKLLDTFSRELKYAKEFNAKGKPTLRRTAYLGARIFIYAREQEDKIYFVIRVELCQQDANTEITRSTTNQQGHRESGVPINIIAKAPGNKTTPIEVILTKRP